MGDPFRSDLQAAHEKLAQQDEKIALLEAEKAALARGAPMPWNTGTVLAITAPVVVAILMVLGGVVWLVAKRAESPLPPIVIVQPALPLPPPPIAEPPHPMSHDDVKAAAAKTLIAVDMSACYTKDTKVTAFHMQVTFSPDGHVAVAQIDQPGELTSEEQACTARAVRTQAWIEPFTGPSMRVGKTFQARSPTPRPNVY